MAPSAALAQPRSVLEILHEVRRRIAQPNAWMSGGLIREGDNPREPHCACLVGWIRVVATGCAHDASPLAEEVLRFLTRTLFIESAAGWNEWPGRTQDEIVDGVTRACVRRELADLRAQGRAP